MWVHRMQACGTHPEVGGQPHKGAFWFLFLDFVYGVAIQMFYIIKFISLLLPLDFESQEIFSLCPGGTGIHPCFLLVVTWFRILHLDL